MKWQVLPKTEEQLIQRLAQKSYDERVAKLAGKRLAQIRRITKDYEEDEIEKLFSDEHIERKKLISPIVPTWEQRVEKWVSEDYIGKEFQEGTPVILTAEWMILCMPKTQSEKSWHMRKTEYIPVKV